jgi:hypothetical protein
VLRHVGQFNRRSACSRLCGFHLPAP